MRILNGKWSLCTLAVLLLSGIFMSSCCKNHCFDDDSSTTRSKFYMTRGTAYKLTMANKKNGNMYFVTSADGTTVTKLNAVVNGPGGTSAPATVFFDNGGDVRSVTINGVTYVFSKNPQTGKVDVTVLSGNSQQIFTGVMDAPAPTYAPETGDAFTDNLNRAMENLNSMMPAVDAVNGQLKQEGGDLASAASGVAAYVSEFASDVSDYSTGGGSTSVEEISQESFQDLVNELAQDNPGMSGWAGKSYEEIESTEQNNTNASDQNADKNTKDGEGAIVSGTGKLKVTLTWHYGADIDLHIFEPGFTTQSMNNSTFSEERGHIYFAAKTNTFTDGYLDFDNTRGYYLKPWGEQDGGHEGFKESDITRAAIENVYWTTVNDGTYYVYLHYYGSSAAEWCDNKTEGPCTVGIFVNGRGYNKTVNMTSVYHNSMLYIGKVTFPAGTIDFTSPEPSTSHMQRVLKRLPMK